MKNIVSVKGIFDKKNKMEELSLKLENLEKELLGKEIDITNGKTKILEQKKLIKKSIKKTLIPFVLSAGILFVLSTDYFLNINTATKLMINNISIFVASFSGFVSSYNAIKTVNNISEQKNLKLEQKSLEEDKKRLNNNILETNNMKNKITNEYNNSLELKKEDDGRLVICLTDEGVRTVDFSKKPNNKIRVRK